MKPRLLLQQLLTRMACPAHMPQLAHNDAAVLVHSPYNGLPCLCLPLCVDARRIWIAMRSRAHTGGFRDEQATLGALCTLCVVDLHEIVWHMPARSRRRALSDRSTLPTQKMQTTLELCPWSEAP